MGTDRRQPVPALGEWAVMKQREIVRLPEIVGELPRGRGVCGAVGTAFIVRTQLRQPLCDRCAAIAQRTASRDS